MPAEPQHPGTAAAPFRLAGIGDEAAPALDGQLAALRRLGWDAIELRSVDGVPLADLDDRAFAAAAGRIDEAGLDVVCVDSRIAGWARPVTGDLADDLTELRRLAPRCAALGTRFVRVMSYPNDGLDEEDWGRRVLDRTERLVREAEQYGLVLLHENCSGWAGARADRMLRLLDRAGSPALRLLFDIGNGVPYGYDAGALLGEIAGHVAHVHVKDALTCDDGTVAYVLPGDGASRVRYCVRTLLEQGYTGAWSMEPHTRLRPHEGHDATGDEDGQAAFVRYGRRFEELLRQEAAATGSTAGAGSGSGSGAVTGSAAGGRRG